MQITHAITIPQVWSNAWCLVLPRDRVSLDTISISHSILSVDSTIFNTGSVWYRSTQDPTLLAKAADDIQPLYGTSSPQWLFIATWDHVGYYNNGAYKVYMKSIETLTHVGCVVWLGGGFAMLLTLFKLHHSLIQCIATFRIYFNKTIG